MLHNILGFGGRMGRLEYFIVSVVFGLFMSLLVLALVSGLAPHGVTSDSMRGSAGSPALLLILLLVVLPVYLWFSLALQAKRFRDIGWDPLYVIPGWIFANMVGGLVSVAFPTVHWIPAIGLLLNLFMSCALLFWPSGPTGVNDWTGNSYPDPEPDFSPRAAKMAEAKPAPRPAPAAWSPAPAQAPSGFGRRGL